MRLFYLAFCFVNSSHFGLPELYTVSSRLREMSRLHLHILSLSFCLDVFSNNWAGQSIGSHYYYYYYFASLKDYHTEMPVVQCSFFSLLLVHFLLLLFQHFLPEYHHPEVYILLKTFHITIWQVIFIFNSILLISSFIFISSFCRIRLMSLPSVSWIECYFKNYFSSSMIFGGASQTILLRGPQGRLKGRRTVRFDIPQPSWNLSNVTVTESHLLWLLSKCKVSPFLPFEE